MVPSPPRRRESNVSAGYITGPGPSSPVGGLQSPFSISSSFLLFFVFLLFFLKTKISNRTGEGRKASPEKLHFCISSSCHKSNKPCRKKSRFVFFLLTNTGKPRRQLTQRFASRLRHVKKAHQPMSFFLQRQRCGFRTRKIANLSNRHISGHLLSSGDRQGHKAAEKGDERQHGVVLAKHLLRTPTDLRGQSNFCFTKAEKFSQSLDKSSSIYRVAVVERQ